ncbi:hypothetical protein SprV_1002876900 [Sparganum proliferum]
MQNARTARKAKEIQGADGITPLTEVTQIVQRSAEQLRGVLNRHSITSDTPIARLPQVKTNTNLDLPLSLSLSTRHYQDRAAALHRESAALDAAPAEVYKHDGPQFMEHLTAPFQAMRRQGEVPQDF